MNIQTINLCNERFKERKNDFNLVILLFFEGVDKLYTNMALLQLIQELLTNYGCQAITIIDKEVQ